MSRDRGEARPRDARDAVQDVACELARIASEFASIKGDAYNWLSADEYAVLRHRLEDAPTPPSKRRSSRRGGGLGSTRNAGKTRRRGK